MPSERDGGRQLTLFSPNRAPALPPAAPSSALIASPGTGAPSQGRFSLRGTVGQGRGFVVLLEAPAGEIRQLFWRPGKALAIDGYPGFFLLEAGPRLVKIRLPETQPCQADPAIGLNCEGASIALLSLVPRPQLRSATAAVRHPGAAATEVAPAVPVLKPKESEEQARVRDQLEQLRRQRYQSFAPKRIDPEEIPPGMRIVRTPFGDRLSPDQP